MERLEFGGGIFRCDGMVEIPFLRFTSTPIPAATIDDHGGSFE
ncbi:MAG: hypothetical protein QMD46_03490 [Methanomicrobiales archaeon]|nr:hypothetical protein [Methanomicrobiales archaeon]MDI6876008.1 hypothetical protein [Methanomicrobiales archaeon]